MGGLDKFLMGGILGASLNDASNKEVKKDLNVLNSSSKDIKEELGKIQEGISQRNYQDECEYNERQGNDDSASIIGEIDNLKDLVLTEFEERANSFHEKLTEIFEANEGFHNQYEQDIQEIREKVNDSFDEIRQDNERLFKIISELIIENHILIIRIAQKTNAIDK